MRFLTVILIFGCSSEMSNMGETEYCYEDSVPLEVDEESPIGIEAEDYLILMPTHFETVLYLEGGETSCLVGSLELHTETLSYIESELPDEMLGLEDNCQNHMVIEASLQLYTEDELLNEVIALDLELTQEAVEQGRLTSLYKTQIYGLDGFLGSNLQNTELEVSGAVGENISGTISLRSVYTEGEVALNEDRIIAAWSSDGSGCLEDANE